MDLVKANQYQNSQFYYFRGNSVPDLAQIIKPEIDNIKKTRIKPKPMPPMGRPKMNLVDAFTITRAI